MRNLSTKYVGQCTDCALSLCREILAALCSRVKEQFSVEVPAGRLMGFLLFCT